MYAFDRAGSHDLALLEGGDLVRAKSKFRKYFVGLFAELRRPRRDSAGSARQRERLTDQADFAVLGVGRVLGDAEMLDLIVLEHLVDRIDRPAGHAGGIELSDPGIEAGDDSQSGAGLDATLAQSQKVERKLWGRAATRTAKSPQPWAYPVAPALRDAA